MTCVFVRGLRPHSPDCPGARRDPSLPDAYWLQPGILWPMQVARKTGPTIATVRGEVLRYEPSGKIVNLDSLMGPRRRPWT